MKFYKIANTASYLQSGASAHNMIRINNSCGCGGTKNEVVFVAAKWSIGDYIGAIRCRLGSFRDRYNIQPGLYGVGKPDSESEVFVSANYKLSFDVLRKSLAGINAWILVLDTKGINVWCAAGKGTFGTEELIRRIKMHGLEKVVSHRRIIVPQLGAVGVSAHEVTKRSGFRVLYGPVRAEDIREYLKRGNEATDAMRTVQFGFIDRLILVPMEFFPAIKKSFFPLVLILALSGLAKEGILFAKIAQTGIPVAVMLVAAILAGAAITPMLLPCIPFRSFAIKGFCTGLIAVLALFAVSGSYFKGNMFLVLFSFFGVPAFSSYLALQFTGATTFTGMSGVEKEIKISLPLYIISALIAAGMFAGHLYMKW